MKMFLWSLDLVEWWCSYGGKAIELQRFAKRVVGLCASASGCERCWSTFESVSNLYSISPIQGINKIYYLVMFGCLLNISFV